MAQPAVRLVAGLGVAGDIHSGETVRHRSRVAKTPDAPNLRQVHLIHTELFEELAGIGYHVKPGSLGENITTSGLDPCVQLDRFAPGLLAAVIAKDESGNLIRKCGVMGIVIASGIVEAGDGISVAMPESREPLQPV